MVPVITVVIPTYNHAHFLGRAIQSVINQTYDKWELIIVDNHSTDNTEEVVCSFKDARIRLLKVHNNGVIATSRNKGIMEAKGEWIAFLDSDDLWYTDKLQVIMNVLKTEGLYDVISTDELMVDYKTGKKKLLKYGPYEQNFYKILLLEGNRLSPSATVIRHQFLRDYSLLFDESHDYIAVEDYDFWLRLALYDASFKFVHSAQGEYLIHATNNSSQLLRQRKNFEKLLRKHVFDLQNFHTNPVKLWNEFLPTLAVLEVRQLASDGFYLQAIIKAAKTIVVNPYISFLYACKKINKRITKSGSNEI